MRRLPSLAPLLFVVLLALPRPGGAQLRRNGQGLGSVIIGSVFDHETGEPLGGVQITLNARAGDSIRTRVTDERGHFAFERVAPGSYVLQASFVGRQTLQDTLQVRRASDLRVSMTLPISPVDLEPIVVTVHRMLTGPMAGFEQRRRNRPGTFITREEIEQRNPLLMSDLLRGVPGATFERLSGGRYTMRFESGCRPVIWVDGNRVLDPSWEGTGYSIDDLVPAEQVEAVEIYRGAGGVPIQFGPSSCGAVVIWTRPAQSMPRRVFRWRVVFVGLGVVGLGLLLMH